MLSLAALRLTGSFGHHEAVLSAVLIPGTIAGFLLSGPVLSYVDAGRLRPLVLGAAAVSAIVLLVTALVDGGTARLRGFRTVSTAWRVRLALAVTVLMWASAFVAIRVGARDYEPGPFLLLRFLIPAALLGALAARAGSLVPVWRDRGRAVVARAAVRRPTSACWWWARRPSTRARRACWRRRAR